MKGGIACVNIKEIQLLTIQSYCYCKAFSGGSHLVKSPLFM